MAQYSYTVEELKRLIRESQKEFNPVIGSNVETDNRRNNDKFYKDIEKSTKEYNGGMNPPSVKDDNRTDWNKTTIDYNPVTKPSKEYTDRVNSQMRGYSSKAEEDNKSEKTGDFEGNKRISNQFKKSSDEKAKAKKDLQKSGLVARELPDEMFDKNKMYESKYKPKKLKFKRTVFLNESQALKRIPEEYKRDGQVIYLKDSEENLYIVECSYSPKSGLMETNVIEKRNAVKDAEQLKRIGQLMAFESDSDFNMGTQKDRINESKQFKKLIDLARNK